MVPIGRVPIPRSRIVRLNLCTSVYVYLSMHVCKFLSVARDCPPLRWVLPGPNSFLLSVFGVVQTASGAAPLLQASPCHRGSLGSTRVEPFLPTAPNPFLLSLQAGFDSRLCSFSRICRLRFARPSSRRWHHQLLLWCGRLILPVPSLGPFPSGVGHVALPLALCPITLVCH